MLQDLITRIQEAGPLAQLAINLVLTLLIIVIGLFLARYLKRRLVGSVIYTRAGGNVAILLGNAAYVGVIAVATLLAFGMWGLDATALVAVLGIGSVAIGLALQDVLKSVFAGVYLLLEQPFKIGDTIVVDAREGEVESIDVRTTILRMRDGSQAQVPNAIVLATTVMNRTAYPARRVSVRLAGVGEDLEAITERALAALRDQPDLVSTPGPQVHVESMEEGKTTVVVDLWRRADRELAPTVLPALRAAFPGAAVALVR